MLFHGIDIIVDIAFIFFHYLHGIIKEVPIFYDRPFKHIVEFWKENIGLPRSKRKYDWKTFKFDNIFYELDNILYN